MRRVRPPPQRVHGRAGVRNAALAARPALSRTGAGGRQNEITTDSAERCAGP
jgi:hypothetical protein